MNQKKNIFLSFRPEFFRPILYDIKKYEYRRRFCDEPTCAYLYLSSPVKKVVGIMHLGKPIHMEQIIENYDVGSKIYSRIKDSLNGGERFAIPIESLTLFKVPVCINTLKELDEHFTVPQCYLNLKNYPVVFNYLKKQECYDVEFLNSHNKIYEDNFAMTCKDMEQTKEFNEKDKLYLSQKKYSMIECGYITKKIRS